MDSLPRALLVSWLFPPHGSVGAKRALRFARHLPSHGWTATVLAGREPPARMRDPTAWSLPEGVRVERNYDDAVTARLAYLLDGLAHARRRREVTATRASTPSLGDVIPTETTAVHLPHAIVAAIRVARRDRARVVWTTSYPYSAHLVGVAVKRALGLPFVADLRDPWTLNFVHDRKPALSRAIERRLESLVFSHADRVVVTTQSLADAYRARYPHLAERFVAIRNGFDPIALPPRASQHSGPVRLVHFGHVYGGARTLSDVLHAIANLRARGAFERGGLVLDNHGRFSDEDHATAERLGVSDVVRVLDPLPYTEGLAALRASQLLLLPAWGTARGHLFLPGKLYDYLLAGAPVLAIGDNPELGAILARTAAGTLVAPGDVAAVERVIESALDGTLRDPPADAAVLDEYSAPRAAARLASLFDALVGRDARVPSPTASSDPVHATP